MLLPLIVHISIAFHLLLLHVAHVDSTPCPTRSHAGELLLWILAGHAHGSRLLLLLLLLLLLSWHT
jgi:hypothetical protein